MALGAGKAKQRGSEGLVMYWGRGVLNKMRKSKQKIPASHPDKSQLYYAVKHGKTWSSLHSEK